MPTVEYKMYVSDPTLIAAIEEACEQTEKSQSELTREGTVTRLKELGYLNDEVEA